MAMIDYIGGTYELRSRNASYNRAMNFYVQSGEGQAKTPSILLGTAGTRLFKDISSIAGENASCRGLYYSSNGSLWAVLGSKVVEVYEDSSPTATEPQAVAERLTITDGSNPVSMTDNGKFLVLVDGSIMVTIDLFSYAVHYPSLPFTTPIHVEYMGQRVYCITGDAAPAVRDTIDVAQKRNCVWWSDLGLDGPKTWDALSFASAEQSADPIIAMAKRQGDIWLFGPTSYEVHGLNASEDLPIRYNSGSASAIGCGAPRSVAVIGEQVFFLGSSAAGKDQVFMSQGYGVTPISNHGIEYLISRSGVSTSGAIGFAYQQEGHTFYVLTIPSSQQNTGFTIVYDLSTGLWHERSSRNPSTNIDEPWEQQFATFAFGKVIVGNRTAPALLELALDEYRDWAKVTTLTPDGTKPLVSWYVGKQGWDDLRLVQYFDFTLDFQAGVGLQTGQGQDPQAMLEYSDDGGYTWSYPEWTSIGRIGQYGHQARWTRLGMGRMRSYKVTISDPVFRCIVGARSVAKTSFTP